MSLSKSVAIVGGHGKVALRLSQLLTSHQNRHTVTSIIRNPAHSQAIIDTGATPLVLSIEDSPVSDFTKVFEGKDVVYWSAGAGGGEKNQGGERTRKVDLEGAIKIFDAIEAVKGAKPRLIIVSCIDIRDTTKAPPEHYTEEDVKVSKNLWTSIGTYMECKYKADLNLAARTTFKWTMLRPGTLLDIPGTGKVSLGNIPISAVPRDDVASVLAALLDREDAAGLGIDLIGGDTPIQEALDEFIAKGESSFRG